MTDRPIALALFGGTCSGKTTLANHLERNHRFMVLSKDRYIYESDVLQREDARLSWEQVRSIKLSMLTDEMIVVDETIRSNSLKQLKELGYLIVAIQLSCPKSVRFERVKIRQEKQKALLAELSGIVGSKIANFGTDERREYWKSKEFCDSIPYNIRRKFNKVIKELYLLGSLIIKIEEPNSLCINEVEFILTINEKSNINVINEKYITENMEPKEKYFEKSSSQIKYCVWDIGGVIYDYTLKNLEDYLRTKTTDLVLFDERRGRFSFKEYMRGKVDFENVCHQICEFYSVPVEDSTIKNIEAALWQGVGKDFDVTKRLMKKLSDRGIVNCVLSNALEVLLSSGEYQEFVKPENRFYSFDTGFLKPESEAYEVVRDKLGVNFGELIFIDDKKKNVEAASDLGIVSFVFNHDTIENDLEIFIG